MPEPTSATTPADEGATRLTSPQSLPVFLPPAVVAALGAPSVGEEVSWWLELTASGESGGGTDQGMVRVHARADPLPGGEGGDAEDGDGGVGEVDPDLGFGEHRHPVLLTAGAATMLWRSPEPVEGEIHVIGRITALASAPTPSTPPTPCRVLDLQVEERRFLEPEERPEGFDVDTPDGYVALPGLPTYTPVRTAPPRFGTLVVEGGARSLETGVLAVVDVLGFRPPAPEAPAAA